MTYFGPQPSRQRLELTVFSWVHKTSQTVGQSFDISLLHTTWDPAPVVSTGDTLTQRLIAPSVLRYNDIETHRAEIK